MPDGFESNFKATDCNETKGIALISFMVSEIKFDKELGSFNHSFETYVLSKLWIAHSFI